jgi:hypothetical protein
MRRGIIFVLLLVLCCVSGIPIKFQGKQGSNDGVVYEAERAFKSVPSKVQCNLAEDEVKQYTQLSSDSYMIFSVNIPEDGIYSVTLFAYSCESEELRVSIETNGHSNVEDQLLVLKANVTVHDLHFRTGLNTITYKIKGGHVAFDKIAIKGGIPINLRGATLPYEEIEAESANYQGTLIGPGRAYCTLPSEASGRQAVQLTAAGNYVEFTPTQSFNAIVLRFSIPNTADGKGQAANLNLLINGAQKAVLNVTSYYSWVYGLYPFSKNPGDGNPHHFYDDVRIFFGNSSTYPAGTKVRFVGASPVSYTIDLADFYNVGAPFSRPGGSVAVTDFGADPSGGKDSFDAFNNAIVQATKANQVVWIPEGRYIFSSKITGINGVTIRGAGPWYTELHGYDFGFFGNYAPSGSTNVHLYDFAIFGQTITRVDSETSSGAGGSLSSSTIQNLWIEHNKCGLWLDGPFDSLHITALTIRNTFADGINFHQGVTNSMVEQTIIRNVGDDALAMWPQTPNSYSGNTFQFNTLALPILANNIAIYGGSDNSATDNLCLDTVVEGAGLQTGCRFGSVSLTGTTTFARNTLTRCGSFDMYDPSSRGEGAIWLYSDGGPITTGKVVFEDITITDALYQAVMFYQGDPTGTSFTNVNINGAQYVWEERVGGTIYAEGVVATNISQAGIWNCGVPLTINQGPGNSGWNSTKCN